MPLMLDVSEEVRAEIGDAEAERLIAGENTPATYDCTSCRAPGDTAREPTSTVLFVGEETAVLAFAHANCVPSQVVTVSENQLLGAVQNITRPGTTEAVAPSMTSAPPAPDMGRLPGAGGPGAPPAPGPEPGIRAGVGAGVGAGPDAGPGQPMGPGPSAGPGPAMAHGQQPMSQDHAAPGQSMAPSQSMAAGAVADTARQQPVQAPAAPTGRSEPSPAVLGITCGLVLCQGAGRPALVVEPTGPIARPGSLGGGDEFVPLLIEHGFKPVVDVEQPPDELPGWSVLLARGELHAVLQPGGGGRQSAWWQAHQPLPVTEAWRGAANRLNRVHVYAAPVGVIGRQPREDLLREALESAASQGMLFGATLPLAGT